MDEAQIDALNRDALRLALAITVATVNRDEASMKILHDDARDFIGLEMPLQVWEILRLSILTTALAAFTRTALLTQSAVTGVPIDLLMQAIAQGHNPGSLSQPSE